MQKTTKATEALTRLAQAIPPARSHNEATTVATDILYMSQFIALAESVARAVNEPGNVPAYHQHLITRLQTEWPTLYRAITALAREMK